MGGGTGTGKFESISGNYKTKKTSKLVELLNSDFSPLYELIIPQDLKNSQLKNTPRLIYMVLDKNLNIIKEKEKIKQKAIQTLNRDYNNKRISEKQYNNIAKNIEKSEV